MLEKFGFTENCPGCEAKITGGDRRGHNAECRARLEKAIRDDDAEADVIQRRDARMAKDDVKDDADGQATPRAVPEEEAADPPAAAAAGAGQEEDIEMGASDDDDAPAEKTDEEDAGDQERDSKRQRIDNVSHTTRRQKVEASLKSVIGDMMRRGVPGIGALCNRDVMRRMIDELDSSATKKDPKKYQQTDEQEDQGIKEPSRCSRSVLTADDDGSRKEVGIQTRICS